MSGCARQWSDRRTGWICAALAVAVSPSAAQGSPNIVLFLVDDMGWQDTSVSFCSEATVWNRLYNTPNMERLAAQGMRFRNAYAASPVCSPTRVSIMTGRNPARNRVSDWVGHGISKNSYVRSPSWATTGLQAGDGNTMLPTILAANGYRTAHVGKAHFGGSGTAGANPLSLGLNTNIGGSHVGSPRGTGVQGSYFGPFPSSTHPNMGGYGQGAYFTDALTAEANAIIDGAAADGVPFFINLAHYAVHTPLGGQGDPAFIDNYRDRPNPEDDYAAMLESMDASLGAVLDNLEEEGIAGNTIVLFMSDNGGLSNHTRSNRGDPYLRDHHNAPLFSGKGAAYEGGIRVPMIVAWAGQIPNGAPLHASLPIAPGSSSDVPVISDDFFTTILAMAGVQDIEQYTHDGGERIVDGHDLTPILNGSKSFTRNGAIHFHYPHQWYRDIGVGPGIEPFSAIRDGNFKLIYFYGDGITDGNGRDPRIELYNLAADIGEQENLADTHPNRTRQLTNALVQYLLDVDAQVPIIRANSQPAELPKIIDNVLGDLNDDDLIQVDDWLMLRAGLGGDISSTTQIEAEGQGDLNFDLCIDEYDLLIFKDAYDEMNGPGAFEDMRAGGPEPSAVIPVVRSLMSNPPLAAYPQREGSRRRRVAP